MAGMGKRMRPHTLTVPKPLIEIAGKPIVQWLVEEIAAIVKDDLEEIAFVTGHFGKEVEDKLKKIAENLGARGSIYYQDEPLGTAHAIYCAEPALNGKIVVAFADTLFSAGFNMDEKADGIIWVKEVDDPSQFGVVKLDDNERVTEFIEKPTQPVSKQAIIGIYYFKIGETLRDEIKYLLDHKITVKGEYQLTDALENIRKKGGVLKTGVVEEWLDCGNVKATLEANKEVLNWLHDKEGSQNHQFKNTVVIPPCFFGEGCEIENAVIGPYVSVGNHVHVKSSVIANSIVLSNSFIENCVLQESFIGEEARAEGKPVSLDISSYSKVSL